MRHVGSIVLSLVFGAAVYVLVGIGLADLPLADIGEINRTAVVGGGALLVAGLLYAILLLTRLSPLGPFLLGLGYLAVGAWPRLDQPSFRRVVPADLFGAAGAGRLPAAAVVGLLAVPLIATVLSPRRWRRWADRPVPSPAGADPLGSTTEAFPSLYGGGEVYRSASGFPTSRYGLSSGPGESTTTLGVSSPPGGPSQPTTTSWPVRQYPGED